MTLPSNHDSTVSINELEAFIRAWRKRNQLCPECGKVGRKNGTTHKGLAKYECTNHKCERRSFNEE